MTEKPAITVEDLRSVSPVLARYTADEIVNGVWRRPGLSGRDRSIITVSALVASERTVGFAHYFNLGLDQGLTPSELSEIIVHVAFYAGWSTAFSAVAVLKEIFARRGVSAEHLPPSSPERLALDPAASSEESGRRALEAQFSAIVPGLVTLSNDLLYGEVWRRPGLASRDRSLVTLSALMANGETQSLEFYFAKAAATGVARAEVSEAITHLAYYIGWPKAFAAASVAQRVYRPEQG